MSYLFFDLLHFIVQGLIMWQYASTLFESRRGKEKSLLYCIGFYAIIFLAYVSDVLPLIIPAFLICNFLYLKLNFHCKVSQSILHSFVALFSLYISYILSQPLLSILLTLFFDKAVSFENLLLAPAFLDYIHFLILQTIPFTYTLLKKSTRIHSRQTIIKSILPIFIGLGIVLLSILQLKIKVPTEDIHETECFLLFCGYLLIIFNVFVIELDYQLQKNHLELIEQYRFLQKEQDTLEYHNMLLEQHEAQRILLHDMKNHLASIALLNEKGNNEEVSTYINNLVNSAEFKGTSRVSDNEFLNSLLSRYICLCRDKNIDFRVDIRKGSLTAMPNEHLTALVCNLLDNAVEATEAQEDSFIEFCIYPKENTPFTVLTLTNSCMANPFSAETGALITHKEDKLMHGFGMKSVRKIVDKYNGDMQSYYNEEDFTFHTVLTIKSGS